MRIFISGGAGYIGSTLVPQLLREHRVTVLDSFLYNQQPFNHLCDEPRLTLIKADARDMRIVNPLLKDADVVIPLAAIVGAPACDLDVEAASSTNRDAVWKICDRLSPSQWLLYPNTNSGYGTRPDGKPCVEEDELRPISHYGRTKCGAEERVMLRENAIAFRFATVFGVSPRMRIDLMVNEFVWRAVKDRTITLFEPHFRRNFIHVRDAANAFVHAINNFGTMRGRIFNAGDTRANMSKAQLCEHIKAHVPEFVVNVAEYAKDVDQRDYLVSNERITAAGWAPAKTLDDGIAELVKLYRTLRTFPNGNV